MEQFNKALEELAKPEVRKKFQAQHLDMMRERLQDLGGKVRP